MNTPHKKKPSSDRLEKDSVEIPMPHQISEVENKPLHHLGLGAAQEGGQSTHGLHPRTRVAIPCPPDPTHPYNRLRSRLAQARQMAAESGIEEPLQLRPSAASHAAEGELHTRQKLGRWAAYLVRRLEGQIDRMEARMLGSILLPNAEVSDR